MVQFYFVSTIAFSPHHSRALKLWIPNAASTSLYKDLLATGYCPQ